jgi:queuine tRNA-ribosyltransferase
MLRPGAAVFEKFGGIHRFMHWDRPVLTDSGGYQIYSMPNDCRLTEAGAQFQSYIDGRWLLLSPETSIAMQRVIGSDIMMPLDHCIASTSPRAEAEAAMERTHRWALRSLEARGDSPQALFGIVQGAAFPDLREASSAYLTSLPFDGFAVGGLAVGESREQREDLTAAATAGLPRDRPRYLMGVGTPVDVIEAVHRGVDMFDCIIPIALAQRGTAYTSEGRLHMRRGWYRLQDQPLDPDCAVASAGTAQPLFLSSPDAGDPGARGGGRFLRILLGEAGGVGACRWRLAGRAAAAATPRAAAADG